jgi:hypothetical protein
LLIQIIQIIQIIQCVQTDRRKLSICHSGNVSQNCRLQTKLHPEAIHFVDREEFNDGCKWADSIEGMNKDSIELIRPFKMIEAGGSK